MSRRRRHLLDFVCGLSLILFGLSFFAWFWSQWLLLEVCYAHGNPTVDPVTDYYLSFHSNGEMDIECENYGKIISSRNINDWPKPGWHFREDLEFATYSKFDFIAIIGWIDRGRLRGGHWVSPGLDPVRMTYVTLPTWSVVIVFALLPIAILLRWLWPQRRRITGRCAACGYDLRATPDRCPECGAAAAYRAPGVITGG